MLIVGCLLNVELWQTVDWINKYPIQMPALHSGIDETVLVSCPSLFPFVIFLTKGKQQMYLLL